MKRTAALIYGVVCYGVFFGTFLYLVGFLSNLVVPRSIDTGTTGLLGAAFLVNAALLGVFGLQHSVMARPGFKARWTRVVPPMVERSTYCLASSVALLLLFWQWRAIPTTVWSVADPVAQGALQGLFFVGVATVLYATFLIDHFDLFGLRQVVLYFRGRDYREKRFVTPGAYKYVRHPLYVGWFITIWATPHMTLGHLLFASVMTAYVLIAIPYEERDLAKLLGPAYRRYRERTPAFVPVVGRRTAPARLARSASE